MALTHRNEQTGNALLDRIQGNVRALVEYVRQWVPTLARMNGVGECDVVLTASNYTNYVLTPAEAACGIIHLTGTIPAAGRVVLPAAASGSGGYVRWIFNLTVGGFAVTVATSDGSLSLATATTRAFAITSGGPEYLT